MAFGKKNSTTSSSSNSSNTKKAKRTWVQVVLMIVKRIFKWLRQLLRILAEIILEALNTTVYLFHVFLKFIAAPSTPCLLAMCVFGLIMIVTSYQWWEIGNTLGRFIGSGAFLGGILGHSFFLGLGLGFFSLFIGLCINMFQLSSEMWKISRQFAEYYAAKNVDTELDTSEDKQVKDRLNHWLSYDHSTLKKWRKISYLLETGIVVTFTLLANMNFWGLVIGTIALTLPEQTLKFVSATISLLGGVSNHDTEVPQDEYQF